MIALLRCVAGGSLAVLIAGSLLLASVVHAQDKKDEIPKKVMDTLKAKFPKAEITMWTKEKEGDKIVYDIEFKQGKQKFEADIFGDGTIHNWEKEIAEKDLPKPVREAVDKKFPKATLKEIMEVNEVKDGKDKLEGYEIVLETADKKMVEVMIAPDGKVLEEEVIKEEKKDKK
ncbi:MAG: hypothetical protein L0241_03840 [Planctomycetia bacterium]|nr:hypothetical protein [Planctomycetia bacterium]